MKKQFTVLMVAALAASMWVTAGCGNDDNKPPDDKSYYTGPMKPKNTTAGPKTDDDPVPPATGTKME